MRAKWNRGMWVWVFGSSGLRFKRRIIGPVEGVGQCFQNFDSRGIKTFRIHSSGLGGGLGFRVYGIWRLSGFKVFRIQNLECMIYCAWIYVVCLFCSANIGTIQDCEEKHVFFSTMISVFSAGSSIEQGILGTETSRQKLYSNQKPQHLACLTFI